MWGRKMGLADNICMFLDIHGVLCKSTTGKKSIDLYDLKGNNKGLWH
jgi:hypothetical protein